MPQVTRRQFIRNALVAGTATTAVGTRILGSDALHAGRQPGPLARSPQDRLRLGVIGVAGRGGDNLNGVAHEEIAVLCDIDQRRLDVAGARFPDAARTDDFRAAIDHPDLDGVVISTPDHMHAIPVMRALRRGLPVYCEKPLTHSIHEARAISELVTEKGVVTQMGNQIHSGTNYRRVVEAVQAGIIGHIRRIHVWQGGGVREGVRVDQGDVPAGVNYDMWLGPAPFRPFHPSHFHFNWRYWWDFGGGQLADFVCHYMDLPYWALGLKYPHRVSSEGELGHNGDNECPNRMRVDYHYTLDANKPDIHMTWYHGGWQPEGAEEYGKNSAVLFEGDDGRILADYTTRAVFMSDESDPPDVPETIEDSVGHHQEWLNAIRGEGAADSPFEYGALLTECGHLGNLSYRLGGREFDWDAAAMKAVDVPEADVIIRRPYRDGWEL